MLKLMGRVGSISGGGGLLLFPPVLVAVVVVVVVVAASSAVCRFTRRRWEKEREVSSNGKKDE
jgi:uncharacterized membrane protein